VVQPPASTPRIKVDVVGPVCETGDFIGLDRDLPRLKAGDLIAVSTAGAYGAVQAGTYNTRLLFFCLMSALASAIRPSSRR
jgi:diaminopimelate decarboxylase